MWDLEEPTHYSKRVGHEVPGVLAVLCEWDSEGDILRMGLRVPFAYHLALLCKNCREISKHSSFSPLKCSLFALNFVHIIVRSRHHVICLKEIIWSHLVGDMERRTCQYSICISVVYSTVAYIPSLRINSIFPLCFIGSHKTPLIGQKLLSIFVRNTFWEKQNGEKQ